MKVWLGLWPGRQRRHSVDAVFPLGGVVEVPPLPDRSLLVKTCLNSLRWAVAAPLASFLPWKRRRWRTCFVAACSRGSWRSAAASPSSEVSLLENQPTQYMTLMAGWRLGVVSSLSPGCLQ